jgi:hypothetical protein
MAFHAFPDDMDIDDAVQQITSDVEGWLTSMPDNFKTSYHALSRPKFGVLFVLKNDDVRARMGAEACDDAIKVIESQWDTCKCKMVAAPAPAPAPEPVPSSSTSDSERLINTLSKSVRELLFRHYDETIVNLFDGLMAL